MDLGLASAGLAAFVAMFAAPWQFAGEVWLPGTGEPQSFVLEGYRYRAVFAQPVVDAQALGLPVTDERFQASLRAQVDKTLWMLQTGLISLMGTIGSLVINRFKKTEG